MGGAVRPFQPAAEPRRRVPGRVLRDARAAWDHRAPGRLARLVADRADSALGPPRLVLEFAHADSAIHVTIDRGSRVLRVRGLTRESVAVLETTDLELGRLSRVGNELLYEGPLPGGILRLRFGSCENRWTIWTDWFRT
jgi:hypothetical protein